MATVIRRKRRQTLGYGYVKFSNQAYCGSLDLFCVNERMTATNYRSFIRPNETNIFAPSVKQTIFYHWPKFGRSQSM